MERKRRVLYYECIYMRWLASGRKQYFTETYTSKLEMLITRWTRAHLDRLHLIRTNAVTE